ncbi:MAG: polysaccharide biosynthesis C-terminal domain-containing protein [Candidatus Lokiarchaeota archaeon]|nr:polysaccharide biosynthesis C-terminal domain-containing protein [Candidatus Lokiarchaeota archaeon]
MSANDNVSSQGGKESLSTVMKTTSTKRVVTGGVILTTVDILGSIFFTIYTMAVARLSDHDAAVLTVVSSFQYMLKVFALLGFTGAGAKFIAEYLERDKAEARKYGISACKYNFLLFGLPIIGVAALMFYFKLLGGDPVEIQAYFILIFLVAIDRLKTNSDTYLTAYQRYDLYAISWGVPYGAMYLAAFILIPYLGVIGPLIAWTLGEISMLILATRFVKKISDFPVRDLFSWRHEYKLFTKMFSFNFLYSLANLCFSLLTTTLLIFIGSSIGILTDAEVQSLGVVSTFSNILINVFGIVAGIQPAISQAFSLKNKKLMENYFLASVKFPVMMSIAVITFFLIFGEEMLGIFYGKRYIVIGLLIMAFLIPSYAVGSFASRYDNILAGIGRPETAILPWFLGMGVAIAGIICVWFFVPRDIYLINNVFLVKNDEGTWVNVDYGITVTFICCLAFQAIGLMIPGIWIVRISVKVLGIRVPRGFIIKPAISAVIAAGMLIAFKVFVPFKQMLEQYLVPAIPEVSGIVYTVIMILVGVLLYLTSEVLLGGFTREDGRFWRSVAGSIPVARYLLAPVFSWGKLCLKLVHPRLRATEYKWITSTKKEQMEEGKEFTIVDDFYERYKDSIPSDRAVDFSVSLTGIKSPYYHVIVYPKVDMRRIEEAMVYIEKIEHDTVVPVKFSIPEEFGPGHHELYIDVEMFTAPKPGADADQMKRRPWIRRAFDFTYAWFDEKIRYVTIE